MSNPLFGNGGMGQKNIFGPFDGMMNFMNQFNQFRQGIQGNPQQMVQNMLQNGQMTQAQFEQLSNMANQIMPFMRR